MFNKNYTEFVRKRMFEKDKRYFYEYFFIACFAHVIMLADQKIIGQKDKAQILKALKQLKQEGSEFVLGEEEDFFTVVENKLEKLIGIETAGKWHIGRSRNELCVAFLRMYLKENLLNILERILNFKGTLLGFATQNVETIFPALTHGRYAQPTTLAHYIVALCNSTNRDFERLRSSYRTIDVSPLGASVFTTTGFPIDRDKLRELACFNSLGDNAYDDIVSVDYILESALSMEIAMCTLTRFVNDLFYWCTSGVDDMEVGSPFVWKSSAMPQKRNPIVLEDLRSMIAEFHGYVQSIKFMTSNTPYTDATETQVAIFYPLQGLLRRVEEVYTLLNDVMESIKVRKEQLYEKTKNSLCTATELADSMVRTKDLSFREAHRIVNKAIVKLEDSSPPTDITPTDITPRLLDTVCKELTGKNITFSEKFVKEAMDPINFVQKRKHVGGPNFANMRGVIQEKQDLLCQQRQWLSEIKGKWESCRNELEEIVQRKIGE